MKTTWKSKCILTETGIVDGYITIENGRINGVWETFEGDYQDAGELRILPGIIDIHNHGFGGWSMTDPCGDEEILGYVKALASVGVTTVLPTAREEAFQAVAQVMEQDYEGARIGGIHSEGPFWARGGENTVGMTWPLPDVEEAKRLVEKAGGKMAMMAIAPELPGARDVIRYLHSQNIKVACCHTAAYSQEIFDAQEEAGLDIATHLGNGMRGIHHRNVGALGALLLLDNIFYEIITDLNHICPEMLRLMFRLQPYEKFCLISDSNYIAGLPVGTYMRYGREMFADEKGLILNSDGRICGSGKWVLDNISQLVNRVGVSLEEAVKMASLNPAVFLGIESETGSICRGKQADLMFVDADFICHRTYVGGKLVYDRSADKNQQIFNVEALKRKIK